MPRLLHTASLRWLRPHRIAVHSNRPRQRLRDVIRASDASPGSGPGACGSGSRWERRCPDFSLVFDQVWFLFGHLGPVLPDPGAGGSDGARISGFFSPIGNSAAVSIVANLQSQLVLVCLLKSTKVVDEF